MHFWIQKKGFKKKQIKMKKERMRTQKAKKNNNYQNGVRKTYET